MNDHPQCESLPAEKAEVLHKVELLHTVDQALSEAFACGFDLWVAGVEWFRWNPEGEQAGAPGTPASPGPRLAELLAEATHQESEPRLVDETDGGHLLVIPIRERGQVVGVATSTFANSDPSLLLKLAQSFSREFVAQQQLEGYRQLTNSYNVQMSDDFEELTFLRSLAEHLELSQVTNDLVQMAETMLPLLRRSIKSESVVMVLATEESDEVDLAEGERPAVWVGPSIVDEKTCLTLIDEYHADAAQDPVVHNFFDEGSQGARFPGVRDFILVHIAKGERLMGWLLAINRVYRQGLDDIGTNCDRHSFEFGTGEASLLSSAASMLATQGRNVELFREKEKLLTGMVRSLVSAIEAKDPYTCGHSERVALYAERLAWEMGHGDEFCENLYLTGLLHDVGKIGVSDATLSKPGHLTEEEYAEIKRHPDLGWAILHDLEQLRYVFPGLVHHHERIDGQGYPDGLAGDDIPLDGRILAVADAYDAMTSDRPYRKGMPQEKAVSILREGAGVQWDAPIVEVFLKIMTEIVKIRLSYHRPAQPTRKRGDMVPQRTAITLDISNLSQTPSPTR